MSKDKTPTGEEQAAGNSVPAGERDLRRQDRRQKQGQAPDGIERRQWQDRRKARALEGRERYLDMVQKERTMLFDLGVSRSTEQLLDMAGAGGSSEQEEEGIRGPGNGRPATVNFASAILVAAQYSPYWFKRRNFAYCSAS